MRFPAVENATRRVHASQYRGQSRAGERSDDEERERERRANECIFHHSETRMLVRRKSDASQNRGTRAIITGDNYEPPLGRGAVKSRGGKSSSRRFANF